MKTYTHKKLTPRLRVPTQGSRPFTFSASLFFSCVPSSESQEAPVGREAVHPTPLSITPLH